MNFYIDKLISFLILIGITLFLIVPKGGLVILAILFLSIIGLYLKNDFKKKLENWEKFFLISFISYFLIITLNNFYFQGNIRDIDTESRFILVIPIYMYLRKSNVDFKFIEFAIILASFVYGMISILPAFFGISHSLFQFAKHTGIVSLYGATLGVTSLFLLNNNKTIFHNSIILIAALLGLATSIIGGGRGVWIAAFLSFITLFYFNPLRQKNLERTLVIFVISLVVLMGYLLPQTNVKLRTDLAKNELVNFVENHATGTSIGARLEMWKSSFLISKDNLIFGIGEGNFKEKNNELIKEDLIHKDVSRFNHPHNEYLTTLVEQGLLGLIFLIFLFSNILSTCFSNFRKNLDTNILTPLIFASSITLHYIFYSLSNGVFDHQNTTLFFVSYISIALGVFASRRANS